MTVVRDGPVPLAIELDQVEGEGFEVTITADCKPVGRNLHGFDGASGCDDLIDIVVAVTVRDCHGLPLLIDRQDADGGGGGGDGEVGTGTDEVSHPLATTI